MVAALDSISAGDVLEMLLANEEDLNSNKATAVIGLFTAATILEERTPKASAEDSREGEQPKRSRSRSRA